MAISNGKPELHVVDGRVEEEKEELNAIARELLEGTGLTPEDADDSDFWNEVFAEQKRRAEAKKELEEAEAEVKKMSAVAAAREKRAKLEAERGAEVARVKTEAEAARQRLGVHPAAMPLPSKPSLQPAPVIQSSAKTIAADKAVMQMEQRRASEQLRERLDSLRDKYAGKVPACIWRGADEAFAVRGELCRAIMAVKDVLGDEDFPDRDALQKQYEALQELIDSVNDILRDGYLIEPRGGSSPHDVYQRIRLELIQSDGIGKLLTVPEPETEEERQAREEEEKRQAETEERKAKKLDDRRVMLVALETKLRQAGANQADAARMAESVAKRDGATLADRLIAAGVGKLLHAEQVGGGSHSNGDAVHEDIAVAELYARAAGITPDVLQEWLAVHKNALMARAVAAAKAVDMAVPVDFRPLGAQLRDQPAEKGKKGKPDGAKCKKHK